MPAFWKTTAVATLSIGSIFSTFGAEAGQCTAAFPSDVSSALAAKPTRQGNEVPYQEITRHAAFGTASVSTGTFSVQSNGVIVRRQQKPRPEDVWIGQDAVTIVRDGIERTQKVPRRLAPFIKTLRQLVLEEPVDAVFLARSVLAGDAMGWRVVVTAEEAADQDIVLFGCGRELLKMEMAVSKTQSREVLFGLQ